MKSVSHIFGGEAKVKIMRLFIFNPTTSFTTKEVALRVKESQSAARKEIKILTKAGLIRSRGKGFVLDPSYPYITPIENFLIDAVPITDKDMVKMLSRAGHLKLVLISGVFLHDREARVDMLVVGDHIRQSKLRNIISYIEAELGKELRYAAFETKDFQYRLSIYDKLIRDILDVRNEKIFNKLGI